MTAKILSWRPTGSAAAGADPVPLAAPRTASPLWTVHKQQWRIDCLLQGRSAEGWNVRVLLNGQWFFCCRFSSWDEAIQAAGCKYAELVAAGWSPTAGGTERH